MQRAIVKFNLEVMTWFAFAGLFYWKKPMTESVSKNFQQWAGDAVTTAFAMSSVNVQDQDQDQADLAVYLDETLQTSTTDYTVAIVSEIATVTFLSAPGSGIRVTIVREEPLAFIPFNAPRRNPTACRQLNLY
ncbi:MAG: hypothetical protein V7695_19945 [Sulfitobacter sp.]